MAYDTACYELAADFLEEMPATENQIKRLAQGIQDYIEDFMSDLEQERLQEREAAYDESIDRKRDEWKHEASEAQRLK